MNRWKTKYSVTELQSAKYTLEQNVMDIMRALNLDQGIQWSMYKFHNYSHSYRVPKFRLLGARSCNISEVYLVPK